jgi:hypothetical protein
MLKNSVHIFVEKIHKMGSLKGSSVPVLYIGHMVPKVKPCMIATHFVGEVLQ